MLQLYIMLAEAPKYGQDSGRRIRVGEEILHKDAFYLTVFGLSSALVILWH